MLAKQMLKIGLLGALLLAASCADDGNGGGAGTADTGVEGNGQDAGVTSDAEVETSDGASSNNGSDSGAAADTGDAATEPDASTEPPRLLLFSRTEGFRHNSIGDALTAIADAAEADGSSVTASEDPSLFTDESLADYDVVVFVMTTGDILDGAQQGALERFIADGNGWVGIHSASDTEYDWAWYGGLVGAYFDSHPSIQEADLTVEVSNHISTEHLPATWTRRDEWYNFRDNPREDVTDLITLDEDTYQGGSMGADHPIAWCHDYAGGRSWYTAGGHTRDSYSEDAFVQHIMGGIAYAAGRGGCE